MKITRVTSQFRITIPRTVRQKLNILAGDRVIFEIVDESSAILRKVDLDGLAHAKMPSQTFSEWESAEDDEAFRDL